MRTFLAALIILVALSPSVSFAAIAIGSVMNMDQVASPASPRAFPFNNVAGTLLVVGVGSRPGGDQVTAVTYAGVSMTLVAKFNSGAASTWLYVYELANPATGTNDISVTHSSSADLRVAAVSYTGADDVEASATGTQASATSWTGSVTTVTDNAWVGGWVMNDATDNTATAPASMRTPTGGDGNDPGFLDSNAAKTPAGSHSIGGGIVGGGSANYGWIVFSIKPTGAGGGSSAAPFRNFVAFWW